MTVVLTTAYLPPVGYWQAMLQASHVLVEAHENYQKRSIRNRCVVVGANGPVVLSIPLQKGKNQQMPIRDVRIAYEEHWQNQHFKILQTCYRRAPLYDHIFDKLAPLFEKKPPFLFDWNILILESLCALSATRCTIELTSDWQPAYSGKIKDFRRVDWQENDPYPQLYEDRLGFTNGLSVIDKWACIGF
jgi:hypothetical protein